MKKLILPLLVFLLNGAMLNAQNAPQTSNDTDALRNNALNVYMSANDYIKKEITFVNYVRDLKDADVYIISTSQRTGSGGTEYSYYFVGQKDYSGMSDTLKVASNPDDTQDGIRVKQVRTIKLGLARYIAKTPLAEYMNIAFSQKLPQTVAADKWNSWVFRTQFSGYAYIQESRKQEQYSGYLSGSRVTENWKINLSANYSYSKVKYKSLNYTDETNSKSFSSLIVRAINDHWSYGGSVSMSSGTYSNKDFSLNVTPGLEYDLFPYSESTRRQLRFLYLIGFEYDNWTDTTRFDKVIDNHPVHSFEIAYEVIQKWGSAEVYVDYRNYLHDWSINNISLNTYLSLRIVKGLSISLSGSAAMIRDQIGIAKGNLTEQQILLQRKQMATNYSYNFQVGLTYTFGSIYNNVVNPRFGR
ncbi:MAG TPA: hypothetical protein VK213_13060 [Bacteroidales bacterium]|nr:hypothetical protein [Bacteroidales bacterium]